MTKDKDKRARLNQSAKYKIRIPVQKDPSREDHIRLICGRCLRKRETTYEKGWRIITGSRWMTDDRRIEVPVCPQCVQAMRDAWFALKRNRE